MAACIKQLKQLSLFLPFIIMTSLKKKKVQSVVIAYKPHLMDGKSHFSHGWEEQSCKRELHPVGFEVG